MMNTLKSRKRNGFRRSCWSPGVPWRRVSLVFALLLLIFCQPAAPFFVSRSVATGRHSKIASTLTLSNLRRNSLTLLVSSSVTSNEGDKGEKEASKAPKSKKKLAITLWIHIISGFVVANYVRSSCWPRFLLRLSLPIWNLIRGLSAMLFAGSIFTTTILEWNVKNLLLFPQLLNVETSMVLPALTGALISGVAQAFHSYGSLKFAPRHVKSALHILFVFGIWWGITDRRSQAQVEKAIARNEDNDVSIVSILKRRRWSNIVSCVFLVLLYADMILKPWS